MRCVDVNVLVYAHRPEAPSHAAYKAWLEDARRAHEPVGLSGVVASGFVRVVTHPRVFREPTPLGTALGFVEALRASPAVAEVEAGDGHWHVFTRLCRAVEATGNTVPDAYLAALAIEHNATWVTTDRGFARFPELRVVHPLD